MSQARLAGLGVTTASSALALGVGGLLVRSGGLAWDIRALSGGPMVSVPGFASFGSVLLAHGTIRV